jgi:hydrogenase-4 component F
MGAGTILWAVLLAPLAVGGGSAVFRSPRRILAGVAAGVVAAAVLGVAAAVRVFSGGPIDSAGGWLFLDGLSAYHLLVMMAVFSLSSVYAMGYFKGEIESGAFTVRTARTYALLWGGALSAMTLVLVSNNLGIMWVGIEATTLTTAFLICTHRQAASLEAMWKYLLVCSVGIAFAFMGTLLVAASAGKLPLESSDVLLWTRLRESAALLDPDFLKAGFIFLLVGYGTKVGLAPMHGWLPDAHSQAPAPVSSIFSGFMLNAALYCLMRYVPLVEAGTGNSGWSLRLLALFGVVSILVAAAFIIFQHDVKRLLAYHSVEHLGIIALGLGLGGLGTFAALFHTLNHSLCKTLGFFCAGRLGQVYGTHDMTRITGTLRAVPLWGMGLFLSLLCLIGVAPFAVFMSEFQIVKAAVDGRSIAALIAFLLGAGVVFAGALRHALSMAWGGPPGGPAPARVYAPIDAVLVYGTLAALLLLGLWMPWPLREAITQAARVLGASP